MGPDWEERSGDWDISNNTAVSSTSNSLCVTTAGPTAGNSQYILANIGFDVGATGAVAVVMLYEDDNNYLYLKVDLTGGAFSIIEKVAGADTTLATVSATFSATTYQVVACYWPDNGVYSGGSLLHARIIQTGSDIILEAEGLTVAGTKAGILNINSNDAVCTSFVYEESYQSNALCDQCFCAVPDITVDPGPTSEIDVTFGGVTATQSPLPAGCSIFCNDSNCTNDWDDTITLQCDASGTSSRIQWSGSFGFAQCSPAVSVVAQYEKIGSDYILSLWVLDLGSHKIAEFSKNFGTTKQDTHSWSSLTLTLDAWDTTYACCDLSTLTCTVTAGF